MREERYSRRQNNLIRLRNLFREIRATMPEGEERGQVIRRIGLFAKSSMARAEQEWALEKHRRGYEQ